MNKKFFLIIPAILILTSAYFFRDEIKNNILVTNPKETKETSAEMDPQSLLAAISKLIIIPKGETPTIATVMDPEQLKDQPFFVNAKKNDKLFIFSSAKEAFLYNPSENRIVKVAPITIDQTGTEQPTTASTTAIKSATTTTEKTTTTPTRKKTR